MVSPRPYKLDVWEWIVKRRIFDPFSVFFPPDVFSSLLIYKVTARDAMGPSRPPQAEKKKRAFPRDGMGKYSRLFTVAWEWDGKVGSHSVDGMGRDYTISRWEGTGREKIPGRE